MQIQLLKIVIAVAMFLALIVGGLTLWVLFTSNEVKPQSQQSTQGQFGSNQVSVGVDGPTSSQGGRQTLPDIDAAYDALFQKIIAEKVIFHRVSSSSDESGALYKLYEKDVSEAKKIFPNKTDFSIGVALVDLTEDGITEALVLEDIPGFCGTGGCMLNIYRKQKGAWVRISSVLVRGEVGVSNTITNGFKNLFLSVSGGVGIESVVLRYVWDGTEYRSGELMAYWDGERFVTQ